MTLRQRLFVWYGAVLFAVCGLFVTEIYLLVAHKMKKEFYQFLADEYEEGVRLVNENIADLEALTRTIEVEVKGKRYFGEVYRLYDMEKREDVLMIATRWEDELRALPPPEIQQSAAHGSDNHNETQRSSLRLTDEGGDEIRFLTGRPDPQRHPNLVLQVGLSYRRVHRRVHSLLYYLLTALAATILLATLGGNLLASRGLRPIRQIATSLEQTTAGNLARRLPPPECHDEVGRIVRSFNGMLARLEEAFHYLEDFTADAAHELRGPLTAAKCGLDVALQLPRTTAEYQQAIRDALDRLSGLSKLVNNLLLLANLDATPESPEGRQQVDLSKLLIDIAEFFAIVAQQKEIHLSLNSPGQHRVTGNPVLLRQLFSNLIENAIRHTPSGGEVCVAASGSQEGCTITVTDTGPGLAAKDIGKIFHRFYTGDDARTSGKKGVGLGLSICKKIVEVHGGRITVGSELGKGTTFDVRLPA